MILGGKKEKGASSSDNKVNHLNGSSCASQSSCPSLGLTASVCKGENMVILMLLFSSFPNTKHLMSLSVQVSINSVVTSDLYLYT